MLRIAPALALGLALFPATAPALVIGPDGEPGSTSPPPDDPGWVHVGARGGLTGVYLGDGWVLTAEHVGAGDLILDGVRYPAVPDSEVRPRHSDGSLPPPDLLLFRIAPHPDLPRLEIRRETPPPHTPLVLMGYGQIRGDPVSFQEVGGWLWSHAASKRWGTNEVTRGDVYDSRSRARTPAFFCDFSPGRIHEAQAAQGDSGGAVFARAGDAREDGARWELAGLIISVGMFPGQPPRAAIYGNLTFAADLSLYRDQILAITGGAGATAESKPPASETPGPPPAGR